MNSERLSTIPLFAVWFGLLAGLLEGAGLWLFQRNGWLAFGRAWMTASSAILWYAPLFNVLIFSLVALAFIAAALMTRRFGAPGPVIQVSAASMAFLCAYAFLSVSDTPGRTGKLLASGLAFALVLTCIRKYEKTTLAFMRRTLPWLCALPLVALVIPWIAERVAVAQLPKAPLGAPSVLLFLIEGITPDRLSAYGHSMASTPAMDRLAHEGVVFTNAISPSSVEMTSAAGILTGRTAAEHGEEAPTRQKRDLGGYLTLPEAFRQRGYRTAAFSSCFQIFARWTGFGPGFIHFKDGLYSPLDMALLLEYGRAMNAVIAKFARRLGYHYYGEDPQPDAAKVSRAALNWIGRESDRPFFTVIYYTDLRAPLLPGGFASVLHKQAAPAEWMYQVLAHRYDEKKGAELRPEEIQAGKEQYDSVATSLDGEIGRVLSEILRYRRDEKTIVAIAGVSGQAFGHKGRFFTGNSLYRDELLVPFIIRAPGRVPAGTRVDQPVSTAAIASTLDDLAAGTGLREHRFPLISVAPLWASASRTEDGPCVFSELIKLPVPRQAYYPMYHRILRSLVCGPWHYLVRDHYEEGLLREEHAEGVRWRKVVYAPGTEELFDWRKDAGEQNNISADPVVQPALIEIRKQLSTFPRSAGKPLAH